MLAKKSQQRFSRYGRLDDPIAFSIVYRRYGEKMRSLSYLVILVIVAFHFPFLFLVYMILWIVDYIY